MLASLLSAKLAAAAAVTLGGVTAAAYAGVLPPSVQNIAHHTFGVPPAHPSTRPVLPATPVGPDGTGPDAHGLCTAYAHLKAHGSAEQKAVALRKLAAAAGGAAKVTAYCAGVAHPGTSASGTPASHPAGKPSALPSHTKAAHPTGEPSSHPTGKPSSHPSGKPASTP